MRFAGRRSLAAAAFLLAACSAPPEGDPRLAQLLDQFGAVAFSSEINGAGREGRLLKWTGPIHSQVVGREAYRYADAANAMLDRLALLSGMPVVPLAANLSGADFLIRFVDPATVRAAAGEEAACYVEVEHDGRTIHRADVYIAPISEDSVRHCLAEELYQGFGLLDDSDRIPGSILHEDGARPDLAWQDEVLLRLLYDPRLTPGMGREEAMALAARIIPELLP